MLQATADAGEGAAFAATAVDVALIVLLAQRLKCHGIRLYHALRLRLKVYILES